MHKLKINSFLFLFVALLTVNILPASELQPANKNGNPGWSYQVLLKNRVESCQATLLPIVNGICRAATAAHCLVSAIEENGKLKDSNLDSYIGNAKIKTVDFGLLNVKLFVNPDYISPLNGLRTEDSAAFAWECKSANGVPEIPLSLVELKDREELFYGKVMGGREGLYSGIVFRDPDVIAIQDLPIGTAQESVYQNPVIQSGDSGGGLYRKIGTNGFELVGVLSQGDDIKKNRPLGTYATNRSLYFIHKIANSAALALNLPNLPQEPPVIITPIKLPAETRKTTAGKIFTRNNIYPQLGDAWKDETGMVWGSVVLNKIGSSLKLNQAAAEAYCKNIGAELPKYDDFVRLREYMGAKLGSHEGYQAQVLPYLMFFDLGKVEAAYFWSSTIRYGKYIDYFSGKTGKIDFALVGDYNDNNSFRCVISNAVF